MRVAKLGGIIMRIIYYNGEIITMNSTNEIASALCIENGKIISVGKDEEVLKLKNKDCEVIDLNHQTMLPGFIDGHSHFVALANSLSQCNLTSAKSFQDIISLMKKFIDEHHIEKGKWVTGVSYDHNFLSEHKHPTREILDQISMDYPIMIIHASSHMGVVNTLALKLLGLEEGIKDPEGGRFGRDNNKLNGYMEENAFIQTQTKIPMLSSEELLKLLVQAQDIYASYGITTVQDGFVTRDLYQLLKYASTLNLLKLDVVGYIDLNGTRDLYQQLEDPHQYMNHLKIGGYKIFLDGSPQGKTAWLLEPYENEKDYRGYPVLTDEKLYELIKMALEDHAQLLAHCNGDGASEQYVSQFEKVVKDLKIDNTYRPVMIHAQLVQDDQLVRMKDLKMIPSFFVAHTYFWGDIHLQNLGKIRGSRISPVKTAVNLNIPYTFHQDTPVLPPDMMKTIWCATNRKTRNGQSIGSTQCIEVIDALKAITINGAYQYFEEETKGSIEIGKIADLVILDKNPLTVSKEEIDKIKVVETIKEGKIIYKA